MKGFELFSFFLNDCTKCLEIYSELIFDSVIYLSFIVIILLLDIAEKLISIVTVKEDIENERDQQVLFIQKKRKVSNLYIIGRLL